MVSIVADFSPVQTAVSAVFLNQLTLSAAEEILFLEVFATANFEENFDLTVIFESLTFDSSIQIMITEMIQDVKFESIAVVASLVSSAENMAEFDVTAVLASLEEISFFEISLKEVTIDILTTVASSFVSGMSLSAHTISQKYLNENELKF